MSLSAKSTDQLFKEGIAAARSQDNTTARGRFREIVKRDDKSEKGWLWLASVIDDADEKRSCFEKVLQINPGNQSAKREISALLATATVQDHAQEMTDTANGVSHKRTNGSKLNNPDPVGQSKSTRRRSPLLLAVPLVVLILVLVVVVGKLGGGGSDVPAVITDAASPVGTAASTASAVVAAASVNPTVPPAVVAAVNTSTALPMATLSSNSSGTSSLALAPNNTLPPTWTPPASATPVIQASGTPLATPPTGLAGRLSVATGTILTADKFLSVVTMKPDGTDVQPFVSDPDRGEFAVFTPDGKYVIYVYVTSGTGSQLLRIANHDGSKPRDLSAAWGNLPPLDIRSSLSLSANGRYLAFSGLSILQNESDPAIYVLDTQTFLGGKLPVTPSATPKPTKVPPTPAPGAPVTQATPVTPTATPSLADLNLIRLTAKDSGPDTWPAISPDGKTVIYANQSPDSAKPVIELFRVAVKANSQPTPLTTDGATLMKSAPAWSVDGKYLAFTSTPLDNSYSDIEIMLADGTGRHVLIHQNNAHSIRPHWSPNGKYIAFTSDRSGANEVYVVDIATTIIYQVTHNGKSNFVTDWAAS